ncbi:toprim domain-containing protein [Segetibacter aerophilus]|uniref:toprim domain-containing protein n=1 Tax=Segetibacter aerophilus TaxID=670293 RepID=UPI0011BDED2A
MGFKNSAGGYGLRSKYFKGSSTPKWVTHIDNRANNISVFEDFFDYLSYQVLHQEQLQPLTNFLILNSPSFFERSLLLMEKHYQVHLYLNHDNAGRKCTLLAKKRSVKFMD